MGQILSLDLSSKASGYCIGDKDQIIDYGCITSSSTDAIKRILVMRDGIADIIKKYNIKTIVVEEVRTDYQNVHTYKILTWLQAAIVIAAYEIDKNIEIVYLYPSEWRATIGIHTGRGIKREALKKEDIKYANTKYQLNLTSDDIADAICLHDAYFVKDKKEESAW